MLHDRVRVFLADLLQRDTGVVRDVVALIERRFEYAREAGQSAGGLLCGVTEQSGDRLLCRVRSRICVEEPSTFRDERVERRGFLG